MWDKFKQFWTGLWNQAGKKVKAAAGFIMAATAGTLVYVAMGPGESWIVVYEYKGDKGAVRDTFRIVEDLGAPEIGALDPDKVICKYHLGDTAWATWMDSLMDADPAVFRMALDSTVKLFRRHDYGIGSVDPDLGSTVITASTFTGQVETLDTDTSSKFVDVKLRQWSNWKRGKEWLVHVKDAAWADTFTCGDTVTGEYLAAFQREDLVDPLVEHVVDTIDGDAVDGERVLAWVFKCGTWAGESLAVYVHEGPLARNYADQIHIGGLLRSDGAEELAGTRGLVKAELSRTDTSYRALALRLKRGVKWWSYDIDPSGATQYWEGDVSSAWSTAGNWNTNTVPDSTDYVKFDGGYSVSNCTLDTPAKCYDIEFQSNFVDTVVQLNDSLWVRTDLDVEGTMDAGGMFKSIGSGKIRIDDRFAFAEGQTQKFEWICNTGPMSVGEAFRIGEGHFTAPAETLHLDSGFFFDEDEGTWTHNSGTVHFRGTMNLDTVSPGDPSFDIGNLTFNNLVLEQIEAGITQRYLYTLNGDTTTIEGDLHYKAGRLLGVGVGAKYGSDIKVEGDVVMDAYSTTRRNAYYYTYRLWFTGTGDQTVYQSHKDSSFFGSIIVDKPSGTLNVDSVLAFVSDFDWRRGDINWIGASGQNSWCRAAIDSRGDCSLFVENETDTIPRLYLGSNYTDRWDVRLRGVDTIVVSETLWIDSAFTIAGGGGTWATWGDTTKIFVLGDVVAERAWAGAGGSQYNPILFLKGPDNEWNQPSGNLESSFACCGYLVIDGHYRCTGTNTYVRPSLGNYKITSSGHFDLNGKVQAPYPGGFRNDVPLLAGTLSVATGVDVRWANTLFDTTGPGGLVRIYGTADEGDHVCGNTGECFYVGGDGTDDTSFVKRIEFVGPGHYELDRGEFVGDMHWFFDTLTLAPGCSLHTNQWNADLHIGYSTLQGSPGDSVYLVSGGTADYDLYVYGPQAAPWCYVRMDTTDLLQVPPAGSLYLCLSDTFHVNDTEADRISMDNPDECTALDTVVVNCDSIQLTLNICSGDTADRDTFYVEPSFFDSTYRDTAISTTTCLSLDSLQRWYGDTLQVDSGRCTDTTVNYVHAFRDSVDVDTVPPTIFKHFNAACGDSIWLTISACNGDTTFQDTFYTKPATFDTTYRDSAITATTCLSLDSLQEFYGDTMQVDSIRCGATTTNYIHVFRDSVYVDTTGPTIDTTVSVDCEDSIRVTISACPPGDTTAADTFWYKTATFDTSYRDTAISTSACLSLDSLQDWYCDSMQIDSLRCGATITDWVVEYRDSIFADTTGPTIDTVVVPPFSDSVKLTISACPPGDTTARDTFYTAPRDAPRSGWLHIFEGWLGRRCRGYLDQRLK